MSRLVKLVSIASLSASAAFFPLDVYAFHFPSVRSMQQELYMILGLLVNQSNPKEA